MQIIIKKILRTTGGSTEDRSTIAALMCVYDYLCLSLNTSVNLGKVSQMCYEKSIWWLMLDNSILTSITM